VGHLIVIAHPFSPKGTTAQEASAHLNGLVTGHPFFSRHSE